MFTRTSWSYKQSSASLMLLRIKICVWTLVDYSNASSDMLIRVFTSHSLAMIMRLYIHAVLLIGYLTVHQYYSECMSFMYSQVITYDIELLDTKICVWTLAFWIIIIVHNIKFMIGRLNYVWDTIEVNIFTYVNSTLSQN